jgi:c-di-GMP-binding flagellar brake protein YcgR
MNQPFKIGLSLTLTYVQQGKEDETYHCKLVDENENYLIIDYPVHEKTKKTKFFPAGTVLKASFVGGDQAIYQFTTKIASRVKRTVPAIAIPKPDPLEIKRIQRRQFVRIDTTLDIAIQREGMNGFATVTSDISGGGLSFIVPKGEKLDRGETIHILIVLYFQSGKFVYINVPSEIVFIQEKNRIRTCSVRFLKLNSKDRQRIISFCFEKQREMRKKELS